MAGDIVYHIVEHHLGGVLTAGTQIIGNVGQRVGAYFYIGRNAAAVAHDAPAGGVEYVGERVRNVLCCLAAAALVVDGLDAAPAGYVILARGEFHLRVIRQVHRHLHQSLSISPCAQNHRTV